VGIGATTKKQVIAGNADLKETRLSCRVSPDCHLLSEGSFQSQHIADGESK
jgi:hypothetical protein